MTPTQKLQLRKMAERAYGLSAAEAIEFAYGNIQQGAKDTIKGIRSLT